MSEAIIAIQRELDKARGRIAELEAAGPATYSDLKEEILGWKVENSMLKDKLDSIKKELGGKEPKALKEEMDKAKERVKAAVAEQENMRNLVLQMKDQVRGMRKFVVEETAALKGLQDSMEHKLKEASEKAKNMADKLAKAVRDRQNAQENLRDVMEKLKEVSRMYRRRMNPPKNLEEYIEMYESDPPKPEGRVRRSQRP